MTVAGRAEENAPLWHVRLESTRVSFQISDARATSTVDLPPLDGGWHHVVAAIRDHDGVPTVSLSANAGVTKMRTLRGALRSTHSVRLEVASGDRARREPRIAGARFYARVLPEAEVEDLRERGPETFERPVYARTDRYCYRIPAIVQATDGRLLAFAERRHGYENNPCSDHGNIDIVLRPSGDGGMTWGPERVVVNHARYLAGGHAAATNPSPVVDARGRTWLLFNVSRDLDGAGNQQGRILRGDQAVERLAFRKILKLESEARVGGDEVDITDALVEPHWRWFAFGPGHGIAVNTMGCSDRLVVPGYFSTARQGPHAHATVFIRDDERACGADGPGRTAQWFTGGHTSVATHAGSTASESQVVELPDGRLMLNSRRVSFRRGEHRRVSISEDHGLTWSETHDDPDLVSPVSHGSINRIASNERAVILFANPACHASVTGEDPMRRFRMRRNMTVAASVDGGRTWPFRRTIRAGSAGYPDLVALGDDRVALLYEASPHVAPDALAIPGDPSFYDNGIAYAAFPVSWVQSDHAWEACDELDFMPAEQAEGTYRPQPAPR